VVLVTHLMEEAERLADRVALIDHGRLVAIDSPAGLILQPEFVTWLVEGRGAVEGGHRRSWRCANNRRSDGGRRPQRRG
jgi:ABC-type proline/glycine betaine transport system ATPase subunit